MENSYTEISQEEAKKMMQANDGHIIVDVRRQDEFDEGHIPGAICIPNESIDDVPPEELPDRHQVILVYCRSGNRSKEAAQKLFDMGYTKVYEFGGGKVREHLGGIYDFLQKKQIESLNQLGRSMSSNGSPSAAATQQASSNVLTSAPKDLANKTQALLSYAEQKEHNKLIKKAEKSVEAAEQKVTNLEEQIAAIETQLATPDGASDTALFTKYGELKNQLAEAEDEWTEASMHLEELK